MAFLLLLSFCVSAVLGRHVVELNEDNFYKVVLDTSKNVFVEFFSSPTQWSRAYAPTYERVAEIFKDEANCVVANVNVNAYRGLGTIYEYQGFMKFWFFPAESKIDGLPYDGNKRGVRELVDFLNEKCGTSRLTNGKVDEHEGRISAHDDLAKKFMEEIQKSDFAAAESTKDSAAVDESTEDYVYYYYYYHVMKKILEKGDSYVSGEISRLENILKGYLNLERRKKTQKRINILKVFSNVGVAVEDIAVGEEIVNEDPVDGTSEKDVEKKGKKKEDIILDAIMNTGDGDVEGYINTKEL